MAKRVVTMLVTAPARSGKTYRRCAHFITQEFLPLETGLHISNFPINMQALCDYMEKNKGMSPDVTRSRIELIPQDVLDTWRKGTSGPWDYFRGRDISNAHIAIDEVHKYCGRLASKNIRTKWQEFCGELGHSQATIEFISQAPEKIAREIEFESEKRLMLVNLGEQRDPFLGIRRSDWKEITCRLFGGKYEHLIREQEQIQQNGKWVPGESLLLKLDPELFAVYDSFSQADNGAKKASGYDLETRSRSLPSLLWYVAKRNAEVLLPRIGIALALVWLVGMGGGQWLMSKAITRMVATGTGNPSQSAATSGKPSQPGATAGTAGPSPRFPTSRPTTQPTEAEAALTAQVLTLSASLAEAQQARVNLERSLSDIVCLSTEFVVFSSGEVVAINERVSDGLFAGRNVVSIDPARGVVVFTGDLVGRLSRSGSVSSLAPSSLGASSKGSERQPADNSTSRQGAASDSDGQRPQSGGFRKAPVSTDGNERGSSTGSRTEGSSGGVQQGARR